MSRGVDVLVVDDRTVDADMTLLASRLAAPNAKLLRLDNGDQALEYLFGVGAFASSRRQPPGLLILDAEMPIVSGPCVLDVIRAHPLTYDIPVVLMSSDTATRVRVRHDTFAADAYVVRPTDFERYCALIEAMLRRWLPQIVCCAPLPDDWTPFHSTQHGAGMRSHLL